MPSLDEIRMRPFGKRGFGCSGDAGRKIKRSTPTNMVKTPSTDKIQL
jgi:hypothetical protein